MPRLPTSPAPLRGRVFCGGGDGGFVARVDFAWPEHRPALEYEGAWHGEPQNVARDGPASTG